MTIRKKGKRREKGEGIGDVREGSRGGREGEGRGGEGGEPASWIANPFPSLHPETLHLFERD